MQDAFGREGDPCSIKVPGQHLFPPGYSIVGEYVPSGCNVRFGVTSEHRRSWP
jgi:hypothetical protein